MKKIAIMITAALLLAACENDKTFTISGTLDGGAGHTLWLEELSPDGTMLGMLPNEFAAFETICLALEPGTKTLMFSDGLSEAVDAAGVEFGADRLARTFAEAGADGLAPAEIVERITGAVRAYEREQSDDQTVVVIARN